jgi:hypothetical protein
MIERTSLESSPMLIVSALLGVGGRTGKRRNRLGGGAISKHSRVSRMSPTEQYALS